MTLTRKKSIIASLNETKIEFYENKYLVSTNNKRFSITIRISFLNLGNVKI